MRGITYEEMARLLRARGTPRGHGHEPHRGVAVASRPSRASAGRRPRGEGPRARRALRRGLQRLDGRAVVRPEQRPSVPLTSSPCGRRARRRRGAPQRRARVHAVCFSEIPPFSASLRSMTRTATGTVLRRCAETETVVNMHIGPRPRCPRPRVTPRRRWGRRSPTRTPPLARRLPVLGVFVRFPTLASPTRRPDRLDPLHLERADTVWERTGAGAACGQDSDPPSSYFRDHVWGCSSTTPTACAASRNRRRQRHLRVGLPALGLDLAHTAKLAEQQMPRSPRSSATRCAATPSSCTASTSTRERGPIRAPRFRRLRPTTAPCCKGGRP